MSETITKRSYATRKIDPEAFIKAWQQGTSVGAVADKLHIKKVRAICTAAIYRKNGVPLKKYPTARKLKRANDWAALKTLAESLVEVSQ